MEKVFGTAKGETAIDVARHIQGRSALVVVTTLARLGTNRNAVAEAVTAIHERGGAVMELATGRRTDDGAVAVQMAIDAANEITRDHNAFTRASAVAGQQASVEARLAKRAKRASIAKARAVWKDTEGVPTLEAVAAHPGAAGWSQRDLYKTFGPRWPKHSGRGGRPRKS